MTTPKKDFAVIQKHHALLSAIKADNPARVKELLQDGADPNAKDNKGRPMLHAALPFPAIVTLLLDYGADVDATFVRMDTRSGRMLPRETPALISAILINSTESARLLIERGANLEAKDISPAILLQSTALMQAVNRGNKEIVELLLDKGARIDERDNTGAPAVWWAACKGDIPILRLLIDRGAALDFKDDAGYTAEGIARREAHDQAAKILKEAPAERRKQAEEKARAEAAATIEQAHAVREKTARQQARLREQAPKIKLRPS